MKRLSPARPRAGTISSDTGAPGLGCGCYHGARRGRADRPAPAPPPPRSTPRMIDPRSEAGKPGWAAVAVTLGYLGVTVPMLPLGGVTPPRLAVLGLHLGAIALLGGLTARRRAAPSGPARPERVLWDWVPLLL